MLFVPLINDAIAIKYMYGFSIVVSFKETAEGNISS